MSGALMVRVLKTVGFQYVEHVLDAEAALAHLIKDSDIHIIVSDLHLAGSMDGRELATTIRSKLNYRSYSSIFFESTENTTASLLNAMNGANPNEPSNLAPVAPFGTSASPMTLSATAGPSGPCQMTPPAIVRALPLILGLSGDADDETPNLCLQAGMDGFLSKPVTRDRLSATIAALLFEKENPVSGDGALV